MGSHNVYDITVGGFAGALSEILEEYSDAVYEASEEGLDSAEQVLIKELKADTPGKLPHKRNLAKGWKGTKRKYKLLRYVGNSVTVEGKDGKEIALLNILEYSTVNGHPFVKDVVERSYDKMAAAVVAEIKKGV